MPTTTIILDCGCVVLVDDSGPLGCLEPCPEYPLDDPGDIIEQTRFWQRRLANDRRVKNLANARRRQRYRDAALSATGD